MGEGWLETPFLLKGKRVFVAGHAGMVGSALVRRLMHEGCEIMTMPRVRLDLRNQQAVQDWMKAEKPDVVIIAAAKVGGIAANQKAPADFLYDNLMIEANLIHAAHEADVEKLLFLGSSCIYPKEAQNPITEDALLTGALEPTNEPYAVAKIAGVKLCQSYRAQYGRDFIAAMPCNLYGPGDNFDPYSAHVIPALIVKLHRAREASAKAVEIWGTGEPRREFLYVDDLTRALIFMLKNYSSAAPLNIGAGQDMSIRDLVKNLCGVIGFTGDIEFNAEYPDGTLQKLMDSSRIYAAGWAPEVLFETGLRQTYEWFKEYIDASYAA